MAAPAVVEGFHVLEDRPPGRLPGREAGAVDELGLERAEEALHGRVVVAVALAAHGLPDAVPPQPLAAGPARVLAGFKWSSQRLSAPTAAPHQGPRLAFASRASPAAGPRGPRPPPAGGRPPARPAR